MSTASRLDIILKNAPLTLPCPEKAVFLSDLHMGDGGPADDFWPNHELACKTLVRYRDEGFHFFFSEIFEGWQFTLKEIRKRYLFLTEFFDSLILDGQGHWVEGNHEKGLGLNLPEAILLTGEKPILFSHGNTDDWPNSQGWRVGRLVARWWKVMEYLGAEDNWLAPSNPEVARHHLVRQHLIDWANSREVTHVHGHIHKNEQNGFDWDSGSWTTPGLVECVELVNGALSLKSFP